VIRGAALAVAAAVIVAVAVAGCGIGFGPGAGTNDVTLTVTRGFGSEAVGAVKVARVPGSETVMRMLERRFNVSTKYGGGFVESIDGHAGSSSKTDWFYYVNGIEAPQGAATTAIHRGDRIWWDLHDWTVTYTIPAVVGSFPEPFRDGSGGRRLPVTLECSADARGACSRVASALRAVGVSFASQHVGIGSSGLLVLVGSWTELRTQSAIALIDRGPSASGVYADFTDRGRKLRLLDPRGQTVRRLGPGAGLIAATAAGQPAPTWIVTGTDSLGVAGAARAMTPAALDGHFALAIAGGAEVPVPLQGNS
jgi:hypothetical protein